MPQGRKQLQPRRGKTGFFSAKCVCGQGGEGEGEKTPNSLTAVAERFYVTGGDRYVAENLGTFSEKTS